jgi:hypothetical protein
MLRRLPSTIGLTSKAGSTQPKAVKKDRISLGQRPKFTRTTQEMPGKTCGQKPLRMGDAINKDRQTVEKASTVETNT